jgi:hypothetical protein
VHIPIEPARAFTIAEYLARLSPSWFEDQGSDRINPNLCTAVPLVDYLRGKRRLFVRHFGQNRYLYEYLPSKKLEKS